MIAYISWHQSRQVLRNPKALVLLAGTPLLLIFILGQALDQAFSASPEMPDATNHFGRIFLVMSLIYCSLLAGWTLAKERNNNTLLRHNISPVNVFKMTAGLFLGSWISIMVLGSMTTLAAYLLLGLSLGNKIGALILLLSGTALFSSSLGLLFSLLLPENQAYMGVLSGILPLFIFLGGGYFPIPKHTLLDKISYISPLRWIYDCLEEMVLYNQRGPLAETLLILTLVSALFLLLAALKIKKGGLK